MRRNRSGELNGQEALVRKETSSSRSKALLDVNGVESPRSVQYIYKLST